MKVVNVSSVRSRSAFQRNVLTRWSVLTKIMDWARTEFISAAGPLSRYARLLERIDRNLRCQGLKGSLIWIKVRRQTYLQFLSTTPGSPEEFKLSEKMKRVWGNRGAACLLKRSPPVIRMVLTAFSVLRSFHLPVKVDLAHITGHSTSSDLDSWVPFVPSFWRTLRKLGYIRSSSPPKWEKYHFSTKSGPSGGPALYGALSELAILPGSLLESIRIVGGDVLHQKMVNLLRALPSILSSPLDLHKRSCVEFRRLVGIEDKEGKTRVIALGDYWSQTALRRLHL